MGGVPSVLLLLWCRGGCSTATVAAALTFFPPCPPCYTLQKKEGSDELELVVDELLEATASTENVQMATVVSGGRQKRRGRNGVVGDSKIAKRSKKTGHNLPSDAEAGAGGMGGFGCSRGRFASVEARRREEGKQASKRAKENGSVIPIALHRRQGAQFTLVYSHGNATDIGAMHDRCAGIADALGVNVLVYDYTGYGIASGSPTEKNTYRDIEAVCAWARANVLREGEDGSGKNKGHGLVLYGQSVGSGPTCYLASEEKHGPFAGVVLHSPIMSGMRVLTDSRALSCLDIYPNVDRISRARCPVMVLHGMKDEEVPWEHGKGIYEAVPEALRRRPWWVRDRGHNDICQGQRHLREYYSRLNTFIEALGDSGGGADAVASIVTGNAADDGTGVSRGQKQEGTSFDSRNQMEIVSSTSAQREDSGRGVQHNAEVEMKLISRGDDSRNWERSECGSTPGKEGGEEAVADPAAVVSDSRHCQYADRLRGQGTRESGGQLDLGSTPPARGKHPTISTVASGSSIFASTGVAAPSPGQRASASAMAL